MAAESILVVEDDPTLVHAITRNLTVRGYAARGATSVAAALAALQEERPDLIVLDIDLPDGSGWEVLRAQQANGGAPVPAIVMSALRPNPRLCTELKTVGELEKPFPMESLLRLISQCCGRPQEPTPVETGQEG
jgi:DNA-binding response OmpR family regulator